MNAPWVFLRGLMRDSRHWGAFPAQFRAQLPDAEIITLDLPGNGRLNHRRSPTRVEAMAEYCRAELQRQALAPPYRLLAMSLGAMVAVAWAQRYPQELQACVLINTSLRPFSPFHHRMRPANYPQVLRMALTGGDAEINEAAILRMTSGNQAHQAAVLNDWVAWSRGYPVSRANALRQLLAAARFRAPLRRPETRVLLLSSLGDRLVNPRCSQRLAASWACAHVEHPDAGHDLPLDDGPWVAEQVRRWI